MNRFLPAFAGLLFISQSYATHTGTEHSGWLQDELLEPDKAFRLSTRVIDAQMLEARWRIADGYYMYRDRFKFEAVDDSISPVQPVSPRGKQKHDPFFGPAEIYIKEVTIRLPIVRKRASAHSASLQITAQGCNEPVGVCYPPIVRQVSFDLPAVATVSPGSELRSLAGLRDLIAGTSEEDEFLHPDQAFVLTVERAAGDTLQAHFLIADGYYLYRDKIRFGLTAVAGGSADTIGLGTYKLPPGKVKVDEFFGKTAVYYHQAAVRLPLERALPTNGDLVLKATYQGCAERGICYPPITKRFDVRIANATITAVAAVDTGVPPSSTLPTVEAPDEVSLITAGSAARKFLLPILGAFVTGLLLTFTPCVLPMIPIVSSVIIRQADKNITRFRAGILSLTYVLGTAVTYTAIGIVAGATGDQLQAYFQNAWAIGILSAIFIAMALSMFGLYELQMPSFIQSRLQQRSHGIGGHSLVGVFVLGLAAALIVGACVSPLLISALSLAIASRDPLLGGAMMFSMALGMGVILIAVGVGAGWLLPKAGSWMNRVKHVFGVLLLAVAIYLLGFIPEVPVLLLWGSLFIVAAVYLGATQSLPKGATGWRYLWKGVGTFLLIWGVLALLGNLAGSRDVLRPLPISVSGAGITVGDRVAAEAEGGSTASGALFERVTRLAALEQRLAAARVAGKPVILDYYADWCTDCLRMERATFSDARVREALRGRFVLLQLDITDALNPESRALKQRFGIYGPPATLFLSSAGDERTELRFYGFRSVEEFLQILHKLQPTITASQSL